MPGPDELKKAHAAALKYLATRDRSEHEIRKRLAEKEFSNDAIRETIDWLAGLDYLDDERFALTWSRSRVALKKFGAYRLRNELAGKGLAQEIIEQTLKTIYSEWDEWDLAKACAEKKLPLLKGDNAKSKSRRLAQYLQRKGFPSGTVFKIVKTLIPQNNDREYSPG